jgi:NADH:ubiquinone oxidoreductase subunit K
MVPLLYFQLLGAALFGIGLYGVLARRSAVLIVLSIELMLNAVNINLIAAASYLNGAGRFEAFDGQVIAIRDNRGGRRSWPGIRDHSANVSQPGNYKRGRNQPAEGLATRPRCSQLCRWHSSYQFFPSRPAR